MSRRNTDEREARLGDGTTAVDATSRQSTRDQALAFATANGLPDGAAVVLIVAVPLVIYGGARWIVGGLVRRLRSLDRSGRAASRGPRSR